MVSAPEIDMDRETVRTGRNHLLLRARSPLKVFSELYHRRLASISYLYAIPAPKYGADVHANWSIAFFNVSLYPEAYGSDCACFVQRRHCRGDVKI